LGSIIFSNSRFLRRARARSSGGFFWVSPARPQPRDAFEAIAVKEVLAWQIEQAMKEKNISRNSLAQRMKTSRSQIGRLLDPKDGNVTLATLQRAARMVGRSLRLELV
jgi:ParB-like chromosome segregation protein Spo0J